MCATASPGGRSQLTVSSRGARLAGYALSRGASNKAHRVVNSRGFLSGAAAFLFEGVQRALLEEEGVLVSDAQTVDLNQYGWHPDEENERRLTALFASLGI